MPSGEEIQRALRKFAARWSAYAGSERGEAQTFLNELIDCYGMDRRDIGGVFEDPHVAQGIVDLHLPRVCIVEMKAPREVAHIETHRRQALDYWHHSDDASTGRAAPPYVVLCAFRRDRPRRRRHGPAPARPQPRDRRGYASVQPLPAGRWRRAARTRIRRDL